MRKLIAILLLFASCATAQSTYSSACSYLKSVGRNRSAERGGCSETTTTERQAFSLLRSLVSTCGERGGQSGLCADTVAVEALCRIVTSEYGPVANEAADYVSRSVRTDDLRNMCGFLKDVPKGFLDDRPVGAFVLARVFADSAELFRNHPSARQSRLGVAWYGNDSLLNISMTKILENPSPLDRRIGLLVLSQFEPKRVSRAFREGYLKDDWFFTGRDSISFRYLTLASFSRLEGAYGDTSFVNAYRQVCQEQNDVKDASWKRLETSYERLVAKLRLKGLSGMLKRKETMCSGGYSGLMF